MAEYYCSCTGCSLNIVGFFSKNFQIFVTSPSSVLGCYWSFRKWPANRSDCALRSLRKMSWFPTWRGYVAVKLKKNSFYWTPCRYICVCVKALCFLNVPNLSVQTLKFDFKKYFQNFLIQHFLASNYVTKSLACTI